jgi:hypothetical protein
MERLQTGIRGQSRRTELAPMNRPAFRASFLALAGALSVAFFFRAQIFNEFTVLFGDRYDGVIQVAILEHWYDVVRGRAAWNVTGYFFPHPDTLGYNDGYVIYGLIYSVFRALGVDPFRATEFVNVVVKTIGFFSFYWFARRAIGLGYWAGLLGAVLFVIADNSLAQALHAQLLSVCFAPLLAGLLWESGLALRHGRRARGIAFGLAAALFYGAWMLTAFYMAWFFGFFLLLLIPFAATAIAPEARWLAWQTARGEAAALGVIAAGFAICLIPFVRVYVPVGLATSMHRFSEVIALSPSVLDIVNLGVGNWLYGGLDRSINLWLRPGFPLFSERTVGFPPVLLLLFAAGLVRTFRRRRDPRAALIVAGAGATALGWLLVLQFRGFTAWHLVYALVPGAKVLRAPARFLIFLDFPVVLLAMWALEWALEWVREWAPKRWGRLLPPAAIAALAPLLLAEQVSLSSPTALNRRQELDFLATLPLPPADCRAFYAATEQPPPFAGAVIDGLYSGNVAAMLVATYDNLPTINGFSSVNPPDWNFAYPGRADYLGRVRRYAAAHHVHALCGLDFRTNTWLKPLVP